MASAYRLCPFEIWSLILDCEFKEQKGYSTGILSAQIVLSENQKITEGVPNTWKSELEKTRQMREAESGKKDDSIFRLQIYMKYKCLKY